MKVLFKYYNDDASALAGTSSIAAPQRRRGNRAHPIQAYLSQCAKKRMSLLTFVQLSHADEMVRATKVAVSRTGVMNSSPG